MRLILHAGTHKTGTTSIQKVLSANRDWLRGNGLIVPPGDHHGFAKAVAAGDAVHISAFLRDAEKISGPNDTIIISSEKMYRFLLHDMNWSSVVSPNFFTGRDKYVAALAEALSRFDVTVLLFHRDYKGYFLPWLYITLVREGAIDTTYDEFVRHHESRFEFKKQVDIFRRHFSDVQTHAFEEAREAGIAAYFFQTIGFPMPSGADQVWAKKRRGNVLKIAARISSEQQFQPSD